MSPESEEDPQPIDAHGGPEPPGAPRWVKNSALVVGVLVVLVVVALVAGGDHGPGRHLGGDGPSPAHTAPAGGGGGHTPPPGVHP